MRNRAPACECVCVCECVVYENHGLDSPCHNTSFSTIEHHNQVPPSKPRTVAGCLLIGPTYRSITPPDGARLSPARAPPLTVDNPAWRGWEKEEEVSGGPAPEDRSKERAGSSFESGEEDVQSGLSPVLPPP